MSVKIVLFFLLCFYLSTKSTSAFTGTTAPTTTATYVTTTERPVTPTATPVSSTERPVTTTSGPADEFSCSPEIDCQLSSSPDAVPDVNDCTQFYACSSGVPSEYPLSCGAEAFFNGDVNNPSCLHGYCNAPICPNYSATCKTSCAEVLPGSNGAIVFPGDTKKFYFCGNSGMMEVDCSTGYFNGIDCSAESEEEACGHVCGAPICSALVDIHSNLPDRTSCERYYVCLDGTALLQPCPVGTTFDLITAKCVSSGATCSLYCPM